MQTSPSNKVLVAYKDFFYFEEWVNKTIVDGHGPGTGSCSTKFYTMLTLSNLE
jgi:hypothetical protein